MRETIKQIVRLFKREAEVDEHETETLPARRPEVDSINETLLKLMQLEIYWRVTGGFDKRDIIISHAVNEALIECDDDRLLDWLHAEAIRLTDETVQFHKKMEASWTKETDCERLDEAFAELDRKGIVARQNFSNCASDGCEEIWREVGWTEAKSVVRDGPPIIGYVFYHQRDVEGAVSYGRLHLSFGSTRSTDSQKYEDLADIGKLIIATFRQHGIEAEWNGSPNHRIHIGNLRWQRRRIWEEVV